jgi:hypothetical protein
MQTRKIFTRNFDFGNDPIKMLSMQKPDKARRQPRVSIGSTTTGKPEILFHAQLAGNLLKGNRPFRSTLNE